MPNAFLLNCKRVTNRNANCFCQEACRQECVERMVAVRSEIDLHEEYGSIENFLEDHLNDMWDVRVQQIITGYSLYRKCTSSTRLQSFGSSLNHLPGFRDMRQGVKTKLCRKISLVKHVYERWQDIVVNVTHAAMIYVDVRKFSLATLAECVKFSWVQNYNNNHAPKEIRRPKPQPEYPPQLIISILNNIGDSGILYWSRSTMIQNKSNLSRKIFSPAC